MDGKRFDDLARALSGEASRRRLLGGLAGGMLAAAGVVARGGRLAAQEGTTPLGGTCSSVSQCLRDLMGTTICGDNGIAEDGALTCCRTSGCCVVDADCCGDLLCAPAPDVCNVCLRPPFATRYVGDSCAETSECVPSVVGSVICGDNGVAADGALTCCQEEGGGCSVDADCCGAVLCANGFCGGTYVPKHLAGAECTSSDQCSQGGGATICADNGIVTDGPLNCCRSAGGTCTAGADCRGGLLCVDGTCQ